MVGDSVLAQGGGCAVPPLPTPGVLLDLNSLKDWS
jgi:hypothetical protein